MTMLTAGPAAGLSEDAVDDLLGLARPGEWIEVFARQTITALVRAGTDGPGQEQAADELRVEVRSGSRTRYGVAGCAGADPGVLLRTLRDARELARLAPAARPPVGAEPLPVTMADGGPAADPHQLAHGVLADLGPGRWEVRAGRTTRTVLLADSTGRRGRYRTGEIQVVARDRRTAGGAQAAVLADAPERLRAGELAGELHRTTDRLGAAPVRLERADWVALAPLVTARLLSRLVPQLDPADPGTPERVGAVAVHIVDDGTLPHGPGSAPFDDEGVPCRRTDLVEAGLLRRGLRADAGNARRVDWAPGPVAAVTNAFLVPDCDDAAHTRSGPGTGLLVEEISGVRAHGPAGPETFVARGLVVRDDVPDGTARVVVRVPGGLLRAVRRVCGPVRFHRVQGVHGGSWCRLEEVMVDAA